jgi:hypothetical protein
MKGLKKAMVSDYHIPVSHIHRKNSTGRDAQTFYLVLCPGTKSLTTESVSDKE